MPYIFNKPIQKQLRQKLLSESPRAEIILWQKLRGRQIRGLKFHRQYGIGNFIVDFYCPEIELVIEVDGDTHYRPDAVINDELRTKIISASNLKVLRFDNNDIYRNIERVLDRIYEVVNLSLNPF
ncbi:MAG: endonuclease domain-containing protein [Candidatus Buchananbacteria bacterium]|jgi:very-short-patch-repair endonuclease